MAKKSSKSKRSRNGQGSIYETTFVDKRSGKKITRWQAQASIPQELGKPKRRTLYGKTYAEVKEKLDALQRHLADGTLANTAETVAQYLERWLNEVDRHVQPRTIKDYRYTVERYIIPRIGKIKLDKLTPLKIQALVSDVADSAGERTANLCRTRLYSALKQAVHWQLIPRNPVEAVRTLKEQKREQVIWTADEAVKFLDTARAHRLYALFYLAMSTGLRHSELIGTRWVDIDGTTLHVRKSKTEKGVRRVALSDSALEALEEHQKRQEAEKQYLGEAWKDTGLVFASEVGTKLIPRNVTRLRHRLEDEAGVRRATLHDLRHLNVSIRRKLGQDAKLIADQIGHTNPGFTLRLYTHLFEEDRANSAVDLGAAFGTSAPEEEN